jgi:hypothetical protein
MRRTPQRPLRGPELLAGLPYRNVVRVALGSKARVPPPTPTNESPEDLYKMMVADFEDGWNAIAGHKHLSGRGNFMFARQAMGVLEFAARWCSTDPTGRALDDFSAALKSIEPRYFTVLPGRCARPGFDHRNNAFDWMLPFGSASHRGRELLWAMFDLVRHGQAHQGQQIMVELRDGTFGISLTGASYGRTLQSVVSVARPTTHLSLRIRQDGGLRLVVRPEMLFLDVKQAVGDARLLEQGLTFPYLDRKATPGGNYDFDIAGLRAALDAGGHPPFEPLPPASSRIRKILARLHLALKP